MKGMKVYVLDCGRMELDKNNLLAGASMGIVGNETPPNIWTWSPIWSVLIDHPTAGYILFDTAVHPLAMDGRMDEALKAMSPYYAEPEHLLPNRLNQLGIDVKDINYVVISHLHVDHAGCLEMFTNATVIVHDNEIRFAAKALLTRQDLGVYVWNDIRAWADAKLNWQIIDDADGSIIEIAEGVKVVVMGSGHTPGLLGMLIETEKSPSKLLVADCMYSKENEGPPIRVPGIMYDTVGFRRTVKLYQRIAKEQNAEIWYGHDKIQWETLIKSTEGFYE